MTRITGSAQKTRRWTKGGSLPKSGQVGTSGKRLLCWLRRKELADASNDHQSSTTACTLDGTEPSRKFAAAASQLAPSSGNGAHSLDKILPEFLRKVIWELFSSEKRVRRDVEMTRAGKAPAPSFANRMVDGDGTSPGRESESRIFSGSDVVVISNKIPLWKRSLDLACVLLSLPVWLPLMVLVMLWIKIASPGPIFYRQARVGYRGKRFMIFKFRSMTVNAEARSHQQHLESLMRANSPMTKLDASGDSRLIAGGRILRAGGLDELPQIFNVLRGEMSLVGPRPCLPYEFERYEPWQRARVNAPPGLTGYWQVNGKNKTTFSEMIEMDILYSKKMSVWLDLTIMRKTVPAIILQILESQSRARAQSRARIPLVRQRQH
jgi:lipopolysaccharide/colanic/teichoic acid biosynthesis glycosyltransferase